MNWRMALARLGLPTLALPASYGVFQFNSLFLPLVMAIISAAAFELVYMGLAVVPLTPAQRGKAKAIALAAVVTSVLYNALAGMFHLRPDLLVGMPLWAVITLSLLHAVPLAGLAYAVADLLFHQDAEADTQHSINAAPAAIIALEPHAQHAPDYQCDICGSSLRRGEWMAMRRYGYCGNCKDAVQAGNLSGNLSAS